MNLAALMVENGTLNPGYHSYPGAMYNLGAGALLLGGASDAEPFEVRTNAVARTANVDAVLVLRILTLTFNLVTVVLSGIVAWSVCPRRLAMLTAAAFCALSAVDIEIGTHFSPDPFAGAFVAALALAAVRIVEHPTRVRAVLAGCALGLAMGAKYNMALLGSMAIVAVAMSRRSKTRRPVELLAVVVVTCVGTFVAVSPMTILDWNHALQWIRAELTHYQRGHPGAEGNSPAFNARTLSRMFGPAILFAPAAALGHRRTIAPLSVGVAIFVIAMSANTVRFERTMLAVTAPVAALVGLGVVHAAERIAPRINTTSRRAAVVLLAALSIIPAATVGGTIAQSRQDPWRDASKWIDANVRSASTIAVDWFGPWLNEKRYDLHHDALSIHTVYEWRILGVDVFVTTRMQIDRFSSEPGPRGTFYAQLVGLCQLASFTGAGHTIVVVTAQRASHDCGVIRAD